MSSTAPPATLKYMCHVLGGSTPVVSDVPSEPEAYSMDTTTSVAPFTASTMSSATTSLTGSPGADTGMSTELTPANSAPMGADVKSHGLPPVAASPTATIKPMPSS